MHQNELDSFKMGYLPTIGATALTCGLIFGQKSLSVAIVVGVAAFVMMFCAGVRPKYLLLTIGAGVAAVIGAILIEPFRMPVSYTHLYWLLGIYSSWDPDSG